MATADLPGALRSPEHGAAVRPPGEVLRHAQRPRAGGPWRIDLKLGRASPQRWWAVRVGQVVAAADARRADRPTAGVVLLDGVDLWQIGERARAEAGAPGCSRWCTNVPATTCSRTCRPASNCGGSYRTASHPPPPSPSGSTARTRRSRRPPPGGDVGRWRAPAGSRSRAAVAGHRLVIADEPTSQLDGRRAPGQCSTVIDALASRGVTVLIATHDRPRARSCRAR